MTASTLAEAFQDALVRHPDRVAVRSLDGEHGLTWLEYGRAVERAAGALSALGVTRGDRIALLSRNRPELLVADLATMHLGASAVALYPTTPHAAIAAILSRVQAKLLLAERDLNAREMAGEATTLPLDGPDSALVQDAPSGFSFADAWQRVRPEDPAAILFTSGTTGAPKGVVWSHRGALGWAQEFQRSSCEPEHVHDLSLAPFASAAERAGGHWRSLTHAGTRTCCPEPARLPEALHAARPTFLFGSPRLWQGVLRYLEAMTGPSRLAVRTGDLGRIDRAGRLHVTGRIKEVLVPLHGHNISPAALEAELTAACPAITHACVIGEGRPHLAAIIAVDPSAESPPALVGAAIQQVNAARDPRERIENYLITGEKWNIGQELTETLKLRRDQIARRYATEIEHLYPNETEPDVPPAASGPGSGGTEALLDRDVLPRANADPSLPHLPQARDQLTG